MIPFFNDLFKPKTFADRGHKSYCCGVANVFSWIAICSGIAIIPAQLIPGMIQFFNEDYVSHPWQSFLIYHAVNGIVLLYNITLLKRSFWFHDFCCKSCFRLSSCNLWII